jgi:hypothetical protein
MQVLGAGLANPVLNLVVIRSADLPRARVLTLGLNLVKEHHGDGPEHWACELGPAVFEIYPQQGKSEASRSIRLRFRVASLERTLEALQNVGVTPLSGPARTAWGLLAVVCDPDGHRVELTEQVVP